MECKRRRSSIMGFSLPGKNGISCRIAASILDLPTCILIDIFSRLPIPTILSCKCVCKTWYTFFSSDTDFANVYLSNPPFTSVVMSLRKFPLCLLELKDDYNYCLKRNSPKIFRTPDGIRERSVTLFGSCNGLLCFSARRNSEPEYKVYVCNPLLGEYAILPQPKTDKRVREEAYGFGFSPKTGEYKVFRILTRRWSPGKSEAQVCTIGVDDDWRVLKENAPLPHARRWMDRVIDKYQISEVTLNGALHWITDDLIRPDFLYSFDIGDEKVRPVPQPRDVVVRNGRMSLGVLRSCLCIYQSASPSQLDIWWMKEYGVVESWTKETIHADPLHRDPYYPIVVWKAGEMFMRTDFGPLISYDPEEKRSAKVTINLEHYGRRFPVPYVPCFLSLKEVVKGRHVEGVNKELNFIMEQNNKKDASANKQWNAATGIRDLPTYILVDIFSRVPCSTIISLKCVCKTWYNLISDPHFGNTYFATKCSVSLVLSDRNSICSFLELKTDCGHNAQPSGKKILGTPAEISDNRVTVVGSCNGLICLSMISYSDQKCTLVILNPQLHEFAFLPQPKIEKRTREDVYGFGFSPATGHYKVLRIFTKKWQPGKSEAQVHTIGFDDGWRTVGKHCSFPMAKKWPEQFNKARYCEVTFRGALHWIVEDSHNPDFIYSFDLEEEEGHPIPPPPIIGGRSCWTSLGVLRDCLCVFHSTCPLSFDIWWMKEYGLVTSWTKESLLTNCFPVGLNVRAILPLFVWKNDEILMSTDCGALISYRPSDKKSTMLSVEHDVDGYLTTAPYFPSFLSLKAAMKGGSLEVVKM